MTVPSETLGLVAYAAGDVRVAPVDVRSPGPSEAVVRVAYGGICGSDLHYWQHGSAGESILREPMLLGHEMAGTVAVAAADGTGLPVGTPVTLHPASPDGGDGTVRYPHDRPNLSPAGTYLGSAARLPHTQGVFAAHLTVPARMLRRLPDGLSLRSAALAEPAGVAWHALARAGSVTGRRVFVVGAGPIGLLAVAAARAHGAGEVVISDLHRAALDRAVALGADRTVTAGEFDPAAVDADVTIECSGSVPGLRTAIDATTRAGRIVMVGLLPPGEQPVAIARAISRELELVGSFRFNDELDDVLAALGDGRLVVDPAITHEFPLEQALEALEVARDPRQSGKVLLAF